MEIGILLGSSHSLPHVAGQYAFRVLMISFNRLLHNTSRLIAKQNRITRHNVLGILLRILLTMHDHLRSLILTVPHQHNENDDQNNTANNDCNQHDWRRNGTLFFLFSIKYKVDEPVRT